MLTFNFLGLIIVSEVAKIYDKIRYEQSKQVN